MNNSVSLGGEPLNTPVMENQSISETKRTVLGISKVIEEVYLAIWSENYEDLALNRDLVTKVYNDLSPKSKDAFLRTLVRILDSMRMDERTELNGFFSAIIGKEISDYQVINQKEKRY